MRMHQHTLHATAIVRYLQKRGAWVARIRGTCLEHALSQIPDALQWLELVEQGYKPLQAGKMLGKNWWWVKKVQRAIRQALSLPPI